MTLGELVIKMGADLSDLDKGLDTAVHRIEKASSRLSSAGMGLTAGLTAPLLGIGFIASKSAMDFESSMANVSRTVKGSAEEIAGIGEQFKTLSESVPMSASALADVAANAGQMGIETPNIVKFTKTISDLSVATTLAGEESSAMLAGFAQITKMPQENFERLGSTIVALGLAGSSTESEMMAMALRIAGAGSQVGLTQAQILAFANALSSVRIEAEAGGTAISKTFQDMSVAASKGGAQLAAFARVAGMSSADFASLFKRDAASAMIQFIQGLDRLSKQGENVFLVLEKLGISERRQMDALLRASGASKLFTESIELGNQAWKDNTALQQSASKFYATTANQLKALKNEFVNAADDLGKNFLPVIRDTVKVLSLIVTVVRPVIAAFSALPQPLQLGIIAIGGLLAMLGPLLLILGQLAAASAVWASLATALGISIGALAATVGLSLLAFGALVAAGVAIVQNWRIIKYETVQLGQAIWDWLVGKFTEARDSVKKLIDDVVGFFRKMYDAVVGHSYVPDMVKGIAREFEKLDSVMVRPAASTTSTVQKLFATMGAGGVSFAQEMAQHFASVSEQMSAINPKVSLLTTLMQRQAQAADQIVATRLDLMLTDDADQAEQLRKQLSRANNEFRLMGRMAQELAPLKKQLDDMAASKLFDEHGITLRAVGTGIVTPKPALMPAPEKTAMEKLADSLKELPKTLLPTSSKPGAASDFFTFFKAGLTDSSDELSELTRSMGGVVDAGYRAGRALASVGSAALSAVRGLGAQLAQVFNPIKIVTSALDESFRQAGQNTKPFSESIQRITSVLLTALQPVLDALVPVLNAMVPIIQELAPVIGAVAQIMAALFKAVMPILQALVPILRALFPVFQQLAISATYLGQAVTAVAAIVLKVAAGIAQAVGFIISGIFGALSKIPIIGKAFKGLASAGDELTGLGKAFNQAANGMVDAYHGLGDARKEIRGIGLDDATRSINELGKTADAASDSLRNVPDIFKLALRQFDSTAGRARTDSPSSYGVSRAAVKSSSPTVVDQSMSFGAGAIIIQGADKSTSQLFEEIEAEARRRQGVQFGTTNPAASGGLL